MEDYEKKYIEAMKACKELSDTFDNETLTEELKKIFPELKESEDDEMFQAISAGLCDVFGEFGWSDFGGMPIEDIQAWIEKQGEQKHAWSEEDEKIYQSIMDDTVQENQLSGKQTDWLKDIKYRYFSQHQNTWKPSDEQMKVLQWCMPLWVEPKSKAILESLINDLKKLRED